MIRILLIFSFVGSLYAAGPIPLPPNFKKCSKSSGNINQCLTDAIQSGIRDLIKGSRPLGVLPVDPLQVTELIIDQGSGPVAVKLDFKDLFIKGIGNSQVSSAEMTANNGVYKLSFKAKVPTISLNSKYKISGKVLILPIAGDGDCNIDFSDVNVFIEFTGKDVVKDGQTHLVFNTLQFKLQPKLVQMHFENLFNGDKALGDNMNLFLNENWKEVFGELKSPIEKAFSATILEVTNRIFTKVLVSEIFPK